MKDKLTLKNIKNVFNQALIKGFINENDDSVIFFDLDKIIYQVRRVKKAFPDDALHAVAIKTNPLIKILEILKKENVGLEAASISELRLAKLTGYSGEKIVFDSPVKTKKEIIETLENNSHLNIDNFDELKRVNDLYSQLNSNSNVCLRINPQIGIGKIKSMSVGGKYSKFGVPINYYKKEIIEAFINYPFLIGLHVHSGSQGLSFKKLTEGVKIVYDLANEINAILEKAQALNRVKIIDIGGGLPVAYKETENTPRIEDYVDLLKKKSPRLFEDYKIITEFGRYIYGNAGWTISKIEYLKHQPDVNTALIHVGADLFLRESYNPDDWYHRIDTLKSDGSLNKSNNKLKYTIGGPLCFGGDILRKGVLLPELQEHDYIVIHDTGANALNLWSRHCSREIPKVIGYFNEGERFIILKKKEDFSDIVQFWS